MKASFRLGLAVVPVFIFVVVAEAEKPREAATQIAAGKVDYETKVFPLSACIRQMIEAGKAQTPREAEEKILTLTKKDLPLLDGESLVLSKDHDLVATLQSYRRNILGRMLYPKIEVTFYYVFVPRSVEPKIKTLSLPAHRQATKPVEWKLSEKQFAAFLKEIEPAVGMVQRQSIQMNIGNEEREFGGMMEINPRHPRNIPAKHYYTIIDGIDTNCVCCVDLAPNGKEYQLFYFLRCLRKGYFLSGNDRTTKMRDMVRSYGTGSFPLETVLVQRFVLANNPFEREVAFLNKEEAGEPNDAFQDPNRDPFFYMAFQVKMVGKPRILQLN
jgi:hypothetical protein